MSNEFDNGYLAALSEMASPKSPHSTPSKSHMGRVWTVPTLQEESDACGRVQVMCPAGLRGFMTAGSDVVRGSGPNHFTGSTSTG
jgi:hypothetical protein